MQLFKAWTLRQMLLVATAIVLVVAIITSGAYSYMHKKRIEALQLQEFSADVLTNGFDQDTTTVAWQDDTDCGRRGCLTNWTMIATVTVSGCTIRLERSKAIADSAPKKKYGNPQMKPYWVDAYADGSRHGTDLAQGAFPFTVSSPKARLLYEYIVHLKDLTFSECFDAKIPAPAA